MFILVQLHEMSNFSLLEMANANANANANDRMK